MENSCKVCGCTEHYACMSSQGPCSWANEEKDLCNFCQHNLLLAFPGQVKAMRDMQKKYFKSRSKDDLIESKRLESEIDKVIPIIIKED